MASCCRKRFWNGEQKTIYIERWNMVCFKYFFERLNLQNFYRISHLTQKNGILSQTLKTKDSFSKCARISINKFILFVSQRYCAELENAFKALKT